MKSVVARLTPAVSAAIATIAVQGPNAVEAIGRLVRLKKAHEESFPIGRVRYGLWGAVVENESAEQVVVCRVDAQRFEIHCHGGSAVCQMIIEDLVASGFESVTAGDFPSELMCEFKREAELDLQRATTDRAAVILLDQRNGALGDEVARIDGRCRSEGTEAVRAEVEELLSWAEFGKHLVEPWQVVLAGPPNAGKSSLMNAITGSERAIVHAEAGTTRDWVEVLTAIDGWPVALSDTAGVRASEDEIESEGVRRALERVGAADVVIFVVDALVGWTSTHEDLLRLADGKRSLTVWNKADLAAQRDIQIPQGALRTAAPDQRGLQELLGAVAGLLVPRLPAEGAAVPFRSRHVELLRGFLRR